MVTKPTKLSKLCFLGWGKQANRLLSGDARLCSRHTLFFEVLHCFVGFVIRIFG